MADSDEGLVTAALEPWTLEPGDEVVQLTPTVLP